MKDYELLEKQAAMMRMAEKYGIDDWGKLVKAKTGGLWYGFAFIGGSALSSLYEDYRFALGVVEGKPVFEGDLLYSTLDGHIVTDSLYIKHNTDILSWTPPKPKTVMVELLREDAEKMAAVASDRLAESYAYDRVGIACRKALEELCTPQA